MSIADNNACKAWHTCGHTGLPRQCARDPHTTIPGAIPSKHLCIYCRPYAWNEPKTDDVRNAS